MAYRWNVHRAASSRDIRLLQQILDARPELVDVEDDQDDEYILGRPLHYASDAGSIAAASLLLDRGADVNGRSHVGDTPLMVACESGHVEIVRYLLSRGADPSLRDSCGATALMHTLRMGRHPSLPRDYVGVVRLLLETRQAGVDACDGQGRTALYWACGTGWTDTLQVLLVEGRPDHTRANRQGEAPRAVAQRHNLPGCIELLQVRRSIFNDSTSDACALIS